MIIDPGAGSGKSSLSKSILSTYSSFHRFSIDNYIFSHHGLYGVDYPAEKYETFQEEAEKSLRNKLAKILQLDNQDVILDFSFAFRAKRNEWKLLVEQLGGRWILLYLDVGGDELRRRVKIRNQLADKDGDSAFPVTEEILERYIEGFERPSGEGEIKISPDTMIECEL